MTAPRRRILVSGASGMLGASFVLGLRADHDVVGTYARHKVWATGARFCRMDLADTVAVAHTIADERPDLVIHAAAMTDVDGAERDPRRAHVVNVVGTAAVSAAAARCGSGLVVISTDAVFDGSPGPKSEDVEPRPVNVYGRTKLEGELAAAREHPSPLIVRTTPVGFSPRGDQLVAWILGRLKAGAEVPGFVDAKFSPIDTGALLDGILRLVDAGLRGVVHLGGGSSVSKYEFARILAVAGGFDAARVVESQLADAPFLARRGHDMSLDSGRAAAAIGQALPGVERVAATLVARDRAGGSADAAGMLAAAVGPEDDTP